MPKILVLYYSSYGHLEQMANAVAEGARETGATVDIKRIPELLSEEAAKAAYYKLDQEAPVVAVADLPNYDAIIVGRMGGNGPDSSRREGPIQSLGGTPMSGLMKAIG